MVRAQAAGAVICDTFIMKKHGISVHLAKIEDEHEHEQ
jgi:hypothetical protein